VPNPSTQYFTDCTWTGSSGFDDL